MGRPRIHDDNTQRLLFRAAEAMVADGGVESLTVRRLADATGTTTRAVYSVFGSKDGIVRALYRESWAILRARVIQAPVTDDPLEDLVQVSLYGFRWFMLNHPHLFRLTFEHRIPITPTREDFAVAYACRAELQKRILRCADAGLIGDVPIEVMTNQFHALCHGLAANELNGWLERFENVPEVWEGAFRALIRGMGTSSQASTPRSAGTSAGEKRGVRKSSRRVPR